MLPNFSTHIRMVTPETKLHRRQLLAQKEKKTVNQYGE